MHDQTAQVDDLRLVALPTAVNCADLFVRFTLMEWHLKSMVDDVRDAATRLVRAVVGAVDLSAPPAMITVRLRLSGGVIAIEVEDDRPMPRLLVPRGLSGTNSGVTVLDRGRQLIWCELPLPTGMDATVVPLPRRGTTKTASYRQQEDDASADVDQDVMLRILSALNRNADKPRD